MERAVFITLNKDLKYTLYYKNGNGALSLLKEFLEGDFSTKYFDSFITTKTIENLESKLELIESCDYVIYRNEFVVYHSNYNKIKTIVIFDNKCTERVIDYIYSDLLSTVPITGSKCNECMIKKLTGGRK